ncbi:MAG: VCBS repeat-containing protein [Acidobacteriaceae bacterium]
MLHRILTVSILVGTAATLAAQSSVSFEIANDSYTASNSQGYTPAVVAGDFNNDGKPDFIQCCGGNESKGLVFRAGNGNGTFQTGVTAAALPDGNNVEDLVAADVNRDGKLDLIGMPVAENTGNGAPTNTVAVWLGNGNGTFQAPQVYTLTRTAGNAMQGAIAVGNFFGDGHLDMAVAEQGGQVELFKNEGNGTFVSTKSISLSSGSGSVAFEVAAGDLNGTGVSDLAVAVEQSSVSEAGPVYALWNDGKGDFTQDELGTYSDVRSLAVSRLNGTGMMDILVGNLNGSGTSQTSNIDVYYGQGSNKLTKKTVVSSSPDTIFQIAGADINGDGYGDIVANGWGPCAPSGDVCAGFYVWLGEGNGSFQQTAQAFMLGNESNAGPFTMADFNRNGMMSAVIETSLNLNAEIMINSTTRAACGTYTISPMVTMCQPVDNTYSPSPVRVQATSYDTTKVTTMQEYIDNSLKYSQSGTSLDATFSLAAGTHALQTKAWDTGGRDFVADRTVTVYDGTPGAVCSVGTDAAKICLPSGDSSSSPVEILANGNTGTSITSAAQLYIDGKLTIDNKCDYYQADGCLETATSVQTTQDLSAGSHQLVFKVWTSAGQVYEAEKTITVN